MKARNYTLNQIKLEIENIAQKNNLPNSKTIKTKKAPLKAAPSVVNNTHSNKKGWPAPSLDILRLALKELPNEKGGPFDNRSDWALVGHAIKGAAFEAGIDADVREIWLDWCDLWGGDTQHNKDFWDSCSHSRTGWGTLMQILQRENTEGYKRVTIAAAKQSFLEEREKKQRELATFQFSPVLKTNPTNIQPRRWLYGRCVIGSYISILAAPGGTGKSALLMTEAIAMATGFTLLSGESPIKPLSVWQHNAEDDETEQRRRLAAAMIHYQIKYADLGDRLFLTSGRDLNVQIARQGITGAEVVPGIEEALIKIIKENGFEVVIFDPLGAMHTVNENSNEAANIVMGVLRRIAHETGAAIILAHHSAQWAARDMGNAGASAARGATAWVDSARCVRQLVPMTANLALAHCIPEENRFLYFQTSNGKANLAAREQDKWRCLVSVDLQNSAGLWRNGDRVQTVNEWQIPTLSGSTTSDLVNVQAAIAALAEPARKSQASPDWVGFCVASTIELDIGKPGLKISSLTPEQRRNRKHVQNLISNWVSSGSLQEIVKKDKTNQERDYIIVGEPATLSPHKTDEPAERSST